MALGAALPTDELALRIDLRYLRCALEAPRPSFIQRILWSFSQARGLGPVEGRGGGGGGGSRAARLASPALELTNRARRAHRRQSDPGAPTAAPPAPGLALCTLPEAPGGVTVGSTQHTQVSAIQVHDPEKKGFSQQSIILAWANPNSD